MIYVDDMYKLPLGKFNRMKMSHLIADTTEELLTMVDKIDVNRKWVQYERTPQEHFDICMTKRKMAIENGAKEITVRQCAEFTRNRINEI